MKASAREFIKSIITVTCEILEIAVENNLNKVARRFIDDILAGNIAFLHLEGLDRFQSGIIYYNPAVQNTIELWLTQDRSEEGSKWQAEMMRRFPGMRCTPRYKESTQALEVLQEQTRSYHLTKTSK